MKDEKIISLYSSQLLQNLDSFIENFSQVPSDTLWETRGTIKNSAGVLGTHIAGNLNHFFGHALGGNDYLRQREQEFTPAQDKTKDEVLAELQAARGVVQDVLAKLQPEVLEQDFPAPVFGDSRMNCYAFLLFLFHHLSYHAGQLNYLVRG